METLSRDILLKPALPVRPVPIRELNGQVYVRTLTAAERDAFEADQFGRRENGGSHLINFRARWAALVVCDEQGNRMFSDVDADSLGNQSAAVLDRIFDVSRKLNGMTDEDVEELEKP